jgi:release factor glutamine methyltransferase
VNEVELLFSEILKCDRTSLYLEKDAKLDIDKSRLISAALKRRISGEPLAYILGKTEFMGLEFRVTPDVLIPRIETEVLVETVIKYVTTSQRHWPKGRGLPSNRQSHNVTSLNILDIGTGSGNIAISLAKFIQDCKVTAIDISKEAVNVAMENALTNRVSGKINFIDEDFSSLKPAAFDIIVSNPPYINTQDIGSLQPEIQYEPRVALDGGADGLDFYRQIINRAGGYLKNDGLLIMEIGFNQAEGIKDIIGESGHFKIIEVVKDYSNIDRVIIAQNNFKIG